ncbi:unnamed protein product, partial [Meganyctiphanes norvegica]
VHGGWSSWSTWSTCFSDCKQDRSRSCDNPTPRLGGNNCAGGRTISQRCTGGRCIIHGVWSSWSSWSTCYADCQQNRQRLCNNPTPQNGGRHCVGELRGSQTCAGGNCQNLIISCCLAVLLIGVIIAVVLYKRHTTNKGSGEAEMELHEYAAGAQPQPHPHGQQFYGSTGGPPPVPVRRPQAHQRYNQPAYEEPKFGQYNEDQPVYEEPNFGQNYEHPTMYGGSALGYNYDDQPVYEEPKLVQSYDDQPIYEEPSHGQLFEDPPIYEEPKFEHFEQYYNRSRY